MKMLDDDIKHWQHRSALVDEEILPSESHDESLNMRIYIICTPLTKITSRLEDIEGVLFCPEHDK